MKNQQLAGFEHEKFNFQRLLENSIREHFCKMGLRNKFSFLRTSSWEGGYESGRGKKAMNEIWYSLLTVTMSNIQEIQDNLISTEAKRKAIKFYIFYFRK